MQWPFRLSAKQETRSGSGRERTDCWSHSARQGEHCGNDRDRGRTARSKACSNLRRAFRTCRGSKSSGTVTRDAALARSLVSAHTILEVRDGEFVSLIDPPEAYRDFASACQNVGTWPVLVGEEGQRDTMLSSPIILYDYPEIAPESPGDLFDGAEIDEILSLRIMTMTDEEKREMRRVRRARAADSRAHRSVAGRTIDEASRSFARAARQSEARTAMNEWEWQLLEDKSPVESLEIQGAQVRRGDRVKLRPRAGGDVFDLALDRKDRGR